MISSHATRSPLSRRRLLVGAGAGSALAALPGSARAGTSVSAADRRFLFVWAQGGWDPTRVFAPMGRSRLVDTEPDAGEVRLGDLTHVAHSARPSVDAFFAREAGRSVIFNGLGVSSISHSASTKLVSSGSVVGESPDWATRLAAAQAPHFALPHLVASGPNYCGPHGAQVTRPSPRGGWRSGRDNPLGDGVHGPAGALASSWLSCRGAPPASARDLQSADLVDGDELHAMATRLGPVPGDSFGEQIDFAVSVLENGLSRCVSISHPDARSATSWDSHTDNDACQSALFESLFAGLLHLTDRLAARSGRVGATLADEVVLVVLSEMGRAPSKNAQGGKDHWPATSALLVGPGLAGGRVLGGFDDNLYARRVDPASGEAAFSGQALGPAELGATLLALGDVDPRLVGAAPLAAALA